MSFNKFTFLFFVLIPSSLVATYYYKYASDQYVSESRYIIQGSSQQNVDVLGMVTGLTGMASSGTDSLTVQNYINSHDFLKTISNRINLRKEYSDPVHDWWARLPEDATQEDLLEYWEKSIVNITFDSASGISILEVTAFEPEMAQKISVEILEISEDFINTMSDNARDDALEFAQAEAAKAKEALNNLRNQITIFSESEKVISVEQNAQTEQGIVAELKQKLATAEAEYKKVSAYMRQDSLKVKALINDINSIKNQIAVQQSRWTAPDTGAGKTVASAVQNTARLTSEIAFAEQLYVTALSALKQAEIESKQKQRYLERIVPPHLPDEALKPYRILSAVSFFLASFMIWGVLSLIISSVREHLS